MVEFALLAATYPLQALLMTFSDLVNRHQVDVIAYLVELKPAAWVRGRGGYVHHGAGRDRHPCPRRTSARASWARERMVLVCEV